MQEEKQIPSQEGGKISFASAEMQKAWSSISELLWHGNEGGWGDAFV